MSFFLPIPINGSSGQSSPSNFSLSSNHERRGQSDDRDEGKQKAVATGEGLYSPKHFS